MRRLSKMRTVAIVVLAAASLIISVAWAKNHLTVRSENKEAEAVVGRALLALKHNDIEDLDRLLFNRNAYHYFANERETLQAEIDNRRDYWGLRDIPDNDILRTVKAKRDVSRKLIAKILQLSAHEKMTGIW